MFKVPWGLLAEYEEIALLIERQGLAIAVGPDVGAEVVTRN